MSVLSFDISADDYHADRIDDDRPCLSKSIIQILLTKSAAHARAAHPRLNPDLERSNEKKYDVGTAAHKLFLEGDNASIVVVDSDAWRTNAAKEARDKAYAEGMTPLLIKDYESVVAMAATIRDQADRIKAAPPLFTDGKPEQTLVWEEAGVLCKARLDWLRDDHQAIDDLKSSIASAAPEAWPKTMFGIGGDLQVAFYLRGARAVLGTEPLFRFLTVETSEPFLGTAFSLAPDALAQADVKIDYALGVWRECLETGVWPGYPDRVCHIHAPTWAESQWFDREARDAA